MWSFKMKVKRNKIQKVDLADIKCGDLFEFDSYIYMKTLIYNGDQVDCVDIQDGSIVQFLEHDGLVTPINGEFVCNQ